MRNPCDLCSGCIDEYHCEWWCKGECYEGKEKGTDRDGQSYSGKYSSRQRLLLFISKRCREYTNEQHIVEAVRVVENAMKGVER